MTNSNICLLFAKFDSNKASQIQKALKSLSIDVWNPESITAGGVFITEMQNALNKAKFILILCTSNFIKDGLLINLASEEKEKGKILIPILFENISLPLNFLDNKEVDLIGWDGSPNNEKFVQLWKRIKVTVKPNRKVDWNILLGIISLFIAVIGVIFGITNPEVRCFFKLQCPPYKTTPSSSIPINKVVSEDVNIENHKIFETSQYNNHKINTTYTSYLSDMSNIILDKYQEVGDVKFNKSFDGRTITLNQTSYLKGFGTHVNSILSFKLDKKWNYFKTDYGIDDEQGDDIDAGTKKSTAIFIVILDGKVFYKSDKMTWNSPTRQITVAVKDVDILQLITTDAGDGSFADHTDWANARLIRQ